MTYIYATKVLPFRSQAIHGLTLARCTCPNGWTHAAIARSRHSEVAPHGTMQRQNIVFYQAARRLLSDHAALALMLDRCVKTGPATHRNTVSHAQRDVLEADSYCISDSN
jgi:hypothetical protein